MGAIAIGNVITSDADVIDNLTSTSTNKPLSANQGRVLNEKLDNINNEYIVNESDFRIIKSNNRIRVEITGVGGLTVGRKLNGLNSQYRPSKSIYMPINLWNGSSFGIGVIRYSSSSAFIVANASNTAISTDTNTGVYGVIEWIY